MSRTFMVPNHKYDLVVIGGGTVGIACFLDATLRGLKTALVEKKLIGRQTNDKSFGLLQGGFKYLTSNTDLIMTDSVDCGLMIKLVPHLLRPQPILLPILENSRFPSWLWERLFRAYDQYAHLRGAEKHRHLSLAEILEEEPTIKVRTKGGVLFYEWVVNPVLLAQTLANAAVKLGGTIYENCEVTHSSRVSTAIGDKIEKVFVQSINEKGFWIYGDYFLNAAGPWAPQLMKIFDLKPFATRPTKGTSIIINRRLTKNGVITFDKRGKYIILLPQDNDQTLIGPTNRDVSENIRNNPDLLQAEPSEIEELLETASKLIGYQLTGRNIIKAKCGLRAQLNHLGVKPDGITHDFIADDCFKTSGIINLGIIYGGKLSNQIRMAKEGIDLACQRMRDLGEWQNIKGWVMPRFRIGPNGNFSILACTQDCQAVNLYNKKYGLRLTDNANRVALEERVTALCKLAPFVFGIRR